MRERDYSPRSTLHADAKIPDGWPAIQKLSAIVKMKLVSEDVSQPEA
jgi:hypothetical protein